jgi:primosomal protein N'
MKIKLKNKRNFGKKCPRVSVTVECRTTKNHQAGWLSGIILGSLSFRFSTGTQAILIKVFRGFLQPL